MADLIQNKINQVLGDVARPTKFKCQIYPPKEVNFNLSVYGSGNDEKSINPSEAAQYLDYFCYAAIFPGMTINLIDFKYKGRNFPVKSTQEYSQKWTGTFYNDERHAVRRMFLDWMLIGQNYLYSKDDPVYSNDNASLSIYQLDFELSKDTVVYTMANVFPVNVSDIEVTYDGLNQIETFTVEFSYTHFEINKVSGVGLTAAGINALIKNTIQNTINGIKDATMNKFNKVISPITDKIGESFSDFLG